ncbi:hypothetical protein QQF64_009067 [Cirrhinus molitorella]|uniref:Uncharacterized protein n=1 Tax=Cirrhinus molitorella TaxID=172907 RepID=A0ABR3M1P8_9TELE
MLSNTSQPGPQSSRGVQFWWLPPRRAHETSLDCLPVNAQAPVPKLLGNLIERGSYSQNEVQLEQVAPIHLTIGPMSVVHPVYISPMDSYPLLIGKDLLDRFEALLDFKQLKIWAQVREPLPPQSPRSPDTDCQVTEVMESLTASRGNAPAMTLVKVMICAFQLAKDLGSDSPQVRADLQLNDVTTTDIILALWADNSAISLTLFDALKRHTPNIPIANKRTRFSLDPCLSTLVTARASVP